MKELKLKKDTIMLNKVIIFGLNDFVELAHYYLTTDSNYEVVAFTVNKIMKFLLQIQ